MSFRKAIFKRYSESFKQKVVNEIESGARFTVLSHGTISEEEIREVAIRIGVESVYTLKKSETQ